MAALFAIASLVERRARWLQSHTRWRHLAYTLSLGPLLQLDLLRRGRQRGARGVELPADLPRADAAALFARRFLARLSEAVTAERATSVADFIAARFGHDVAIARLVTLIALLGSIPYAALQLRSIGTAMTIVSRHPVTVPAMVVAAVLLAGFAVLFGARRFEVAGRSEGLVYAIGVDSLFKLLALLAVAGLALSVLLRLPPTELHVAARWLGQRFEPHRLSVETGVILLISATAIIALPRQFHMGLVEARDPADLGRARFGLAAYLGVMAVLVLPIALSGLGFAETGATPDSFVLQLPMLAGQPWIVTAALLGGVSAAASMAIVDATALATMISNHLVFPALRDDARRGAGVIGARMLRVRRAAVLVFMLLALAWALLVSASSSLASTGLIAFSAMAQFTPHPILAANGGGRPPAAARASLGAGLVLWLYTLALPPILPASWLAWLRGTPLDPLQLFGIGSASPLVHGVAWSLGVNLLVLATSSRIIATPALPRFLRAQRAVSDMPSLVDLTAGFIGRDRAEREFPLASAGQPVDRRAARRAQDLIARVVGASSARMLVTSALAGGRMSLHEVTRLLGEGGQSLRFSRQLLAATFENVDAGISVVDAEMNLVAWNSRYLELFDYPAGMVQVGVPVAELIRYNAARGDFGPGDVEFHVDKRLGHLRRGLEHSFERRRTDGRVIKTVGGPMPGGGYVMSFTDITGEARAREELRRTLDELEQRVARAHPRAVGGQPAAGGSRSRQDPLPGRRQPRPVAAAARRAAVHGGAGPRCRRPAGSAGPSRRRRDRRCRGSAARPPRHLAARCRRGQSAPRTGRAARFPCRPVDSFRPLAEERGLALRLGPCPGRVHTDPALLRSVIQNLLSNALRYTPRGAILVGCRRRAGDWRIDVIDTGVGIDPNQIDAIFGEFTRLGEVEVEGLGLGLALVERISRVLGGRVEVTSVPGRGSCFSFTLPSLGGPAEAAARTDAPCMPVLPPSTVLVVDNDARIVAATSALLERWGHHPTPARTIDEALALCEGVDLMLVDYQLDHGEDGLSLIAAVRHRCPGLPALLVTAENGDSMLRQAAAMGVPVLAKPVDPARLLRAMADCVT